MDGKERWRYSFHDCVRAAKQERFGTVILENNLDMTVEEIYLAYSKRWEIETMMRYYKQSCEFDETRVHDDYSVYAT